MGCARGRGGLPSLGWGQWGGGVDGEALIQLCPPGMLLYNGQKQIPGSPANLANRQPDFISFGLVGGRPEFR